LRERQQRLEAERRAREQAEEDRRRRLAGEEEARRVAAEKERARQEAGRQAREEEEARRREAYRTYLVRRPTYLAAMDQAGSRDEAVRKQAARHLLQVLLYDGDVEVKRRAARALARTGSAAADQLETLASLPPADHRELRADIEHAVAVIRLAESVAGAVAKYWHLTTTEKAGDPGEARRLCASKQEALQKLYEALKDSPVAGDCAEAAQALLDAAGRYQEMPDRNTREKACGYLVSLVKGKRLTADHVVPELVKVISGRNAGLQAIEALGNMGVDARAAIPALKALQADSHRSVREAATLALQKIESP
jgi:hypothetical protein